MKGEPGQLRGGVLKLFDVVVMAIAGTAPAYSLAATAGIIIGAVGLASPAAILYAAIPMLGIAWSFARLNRWQVSAGASYAWVGGSVGPTLGFMAGWALVVSATLFMVAGSLPAGTATLVLFAPQLANNTLAATLTGAGWFLIMDVLIIVGITLTVRVQWIMTVVELILLFIFAIAGIVKFHGHLAANTFHWSWIFSLSQFHSLGAFSAGAVIAAFFYWGWDVTANLSEETASSKRITGLGTLLGMAVLITIFVLFMNTVEMGMTATTATNNSADIFPVLGEMIFPGPVGKLLVLALILSTVATLETTLLQVSRTLFAMGRDAALPVSLARIHPRWETPWIASLVVAVVATVLFVASNLLSGVGAIMTDAINAIGLQIVFYYGLAGIALTVLYRRQLLQSVKTFVLYGLWPVLSAIYLLGVGLYDLPQLGWVPDLLGVGLLAVGLIPMYVAKRKGSRFFAQTRQVMSDAPEDRESAG